MRLWIGTSGYSYPEWKGPFYPADLSAKKMFGYYSERVPTDEINATFYRMPTDKLVDISPMALRMSSPFNSGYWLTAA